MPRLRKPEQVVQSIIHKQLRFIDRKDPKDVTSMDLNLVINYFKAIHGGAEDERPFEEVSDADLERDIT